MKAIRKKSLQSKGWKFGSAKDFLGLSKEEAIYVEIKLKLSSLLRNRRLKSEISQAKLAAKLHSSQSRVAKMEAGDASVSLDLLVRSLLALGSSKKSLAKAFT